MNIKRAIKLAKQDLKLCTLKKPCSGCELGKELISACEIMEAALKEVVCATKLTKAHTAALAGLKKVTGK